VALSPTPTNRACFVAKGTGNAKQSCRERGNREAPFSDAFGFAVGAIVKSLLFFWLTAFTLLIALTVGGATRQGLGSDAIPEFVSLPLLAMALPRAWPTLRRSRSALALVIGVVALPCLQLVPLPYWLWSSLPGRQSIVDILATAGAPLSWRPISLIPGATERALVSLLPVVAIFLSVLSLDRYERMLLLLLAVAVGVLSALIAMVQVLGGSDSGLYFFNITNVGRGVGFFANANHFAAFEYALLPIAAAALSEIQIRSLAYSLAVFGLVVPALLFGLALSGSRSAIILGAVSILATIPLILGPEIARWGHRRTLWLLAFLALALVPLMGGLGLMAIFTRFATQDVAEDARWIIAAETWRAILSFAPFGAGVGTFPRVYPLHESAAALIPQLVNRAHDDLLETLFEGGLASLALLLAFLCWFFVVARRALLGNLEVAGSQARAGVIAITLLLMHSLWDYPLRTIALETLFALCVGLQFEPPPPSREHSGIWSLRLGRKKRRRRRKRSRGRSSPEGDLAPEKSHSANA
jgi:O-antigen ligase